MQKRKKFAIPLLIGVLSISALALCVYTFLRLVDYLQIGQCDFDDYLHDPKVEESFRTAISSFESQHNLDLGDGLSSPTCSRAEWYRTWLTYRTPASLSKYGIVYEMQLWGYYDPHSGEVTLEMIDGPSETQKVLDYIDSLSAAVIEFESNTQVDEFAQRFDEMGIGIDGIILNDELWIESDRRISSANPSLVANIFFSIPQSTIRSYTLPNRMAWQEFPELKAFHHIVNEHFLVGELSDCSISTDTKTQSTTSIFFHPKSESIWAGTRLSCGKDASEKVLSVILFSDGSFELESIK
jgi:hypothetical protein